MFSGIIYGLVDPTTKLIRYIGQTTDIRARSTQHRWHAKRKRTHRDNWICSLLRQSTSFEVVVLEQPANEEALNNAEIWWIGYGYASGWPLTNHAGGGASGKHSLETKAKLSAIAKARSPRKQSEEERAKRSEALKGKQLGLGYKHTDEAKTAISAARKARGAIRFKGDKPKLRINLLGDAS